MTEIGIFEIFERLGRFFGILVEIARQPAGRIIEYVTLTQQTIFTATNFFTGEVELFTILPQILTDTSILAPIIKGFIGTLGDILTALGLYDLPFSLAIILLFAETLMFIMLIKFLVKLFT